MLSKSSSLRSQQTTTKELIPSITASANTLATQHQHGTQEPHWQILATFSMNSELRWSFPSGKCWNWSGSKEKNEEVKWNFSPDSSHCSLKCIGGGSIKFYFESLTPAFAASRPTCAECLRSWISVIVRNQWSSSCIEHDGSENMLAQTCEVRLPTSAQSFPHHSRLLLFLRVGKLHLRTWELLLFLSKALLRSHSDIIVPLRNRY